MTSATGLDVNLSTLPETSSSHLGSDEFLFGKGPLIGAMLVFGSASLEKFRCKQFPMSSTPDFFEIKKSQVGHELIQLIW